MFGQSKKDKYFFSYDKNLSRFLIDHGHKYITKAINIKDKSVFTLFEKTDDLIELVNEWNERRKGRIS